MIFTKTDKTLLDRAARRQRDKLSADVDDEMFGAEDAEYFRFAGIDDIGNKR